MAEEAARISPCSSGLADLLSFGIPYVANPDLVARLHRDPVPMNAPDPATFHGEGPGGYTGCPGLPAAARHPGCVRRTFRNPAAPLT